MPPFNPSHIEPLSCSLLGPNAQMDILRDDLIHPLVSGNKWRKLKYVVEQVQKDKAGPIVTFGGAFSNHLVATAFTGKYFNIRTHGFVRGDEQRELNLYERTCLENDMTLQHVSRTMYRNKEALFLEFKAMHPNAVFLDEGGDHPLALKGCSEILDELDKTYDHIVLATGTGTTVEGLVKGVSEKNLDTRIIGISALKNNLDLDRRLNGYPKKHWEIFHDYHRGKYASTDDELLQFITRFYQETSIRLEPVYTGKMMMAVADLYRREFFKAGHKLLIIHTGGLLAFPGTPA